MRKVLVLLLTVGSTLGVSPLTATAAEEVSITVVVDDTTIACSPEVATWNPDTTPISENFDLFIGTPETQGFTVSLNFIDGFDPICNEIYVPTGTIRSSFVPTDDWGLNLSSMECLDNSCAAADISNDGVGGELSGAFYIPQTTGTYGGILTITWTP